MSNFSDFSLQQAIYQLLSADSTLLAMITGVFDRPPEGSAYPYVTIGDTVISDWSTKTSTGTEQQLTLHVWSVYGGRAEAVNIMQRLYQLLHQASMTVTGQTLVLMRFVSSEILLENDGYTYHGLIRFRAFLEAA